MIRPRIILLSASLVLCGVAFANEWLPVAQATEPRSSPDSLTVTSGPLRFEERLIRGDYGYAYGIAAADLDHDGDLDLTSADTTNDLLLWFENDGHGQLTEHRIAEQDPGWFERHQIIDMNGDGHLDVVVVKNRVGDLLWFENSGHPRDGQVWQRHVITEKTLPGMYDVAAADFDGDGDIDCAASSYGRGNLFASYENPGPSNGSPPWDMRIIERDLGETRTIEAADINRDGRPDLLGTAMTANLTVWYENTGEPGAARWRKRIIDDQSGHPVHGHAFDFDGDGDLDVIMALGYFSGAEVEDTNQVAWYENLGTPGSGETWQKHRVGDLASGFEAVAGDLDGDGDNDIVATSFGGPLSGVTWFENPGAGSSETWKSYPLKELWQNSNSVIIVDLDADGRLDIAACAERGANEFRWWRNLGPVAAP